MSDQPRFTALVMAGSRAAGDPLATASGVHAKALVPVDGVPMLVRVITTLRAARNVGRIIILGLDALPGDPALSAAGIELARGAESPAASARWAIEALALVPPILITTADHPLLTSDMVDEFCDASRAGDADVTFGIADGDRVAATFPGIRRTVHRFRDARVCGCNLYALLSAAGCTAPRLWLQVESYRKKPWRMVAMLGLPVLLRFLLGRLALSDVGPVVEARMHLRIRPIPLSDPAAGFDVDTIAQREVAERYLRSRGTG